jgi:monofunctional glycosyltransferase
VILFRVIRLRRSNPATTSFIRQRSRELTAQGKTLQFQIIWIPYNRISPHLLHGVVAEEDPRFWTHPGFDARSILRALKTDWRARKIVKGASTLDQQLAKNLFFSRSKNPLRKVEEIIVALEMEIFLPKTRILEIYLNVIEWGDGIYGAEAAAQHYFQISASSLNFEQAAFLTAIIPGPRGGFNPLAYPARVKTRADEILKGIRRRHFEGLVSFNFDDGYESVYKFGLPVLDKAGIKSTQYIITGSIGQATFVTARQLLEMQAHGHEIGAHTRSHPPLSTLAEAEIADEINGSLNDLLALRIHPTTFSYPYGDFNDRVVSVVKVAGFQGARTTEAGFNDAESQALRLKCQIVDSKTILRNVKRAIDEADAGGYWLVLLFHRVDEDDNPTSVRHELLQETVDYVIQKKVHVVTTSEGLAAMQLSP